MKVKVKFYFEDKGVIDGEITVPKYASAKQMEEEASDIYRGLCEKFAKGQGVKVVSKIYKERSL